jgi:hypothetical protein
MPTGGGARVRKRCRIERSRKKPPADQNDVILALARASKAEVLRRMGLSPAGKMRAGA